MKKSAIFTTALIITGLIGMTGCNTVSEQDRGEIAKAALLYAQTEPADEAITAESSEEADEEIIEESDYEESVTVEEPVDEEPEVQEIAFKAVDKYASATRNYIVRCGASNHTESIGSSEGGDEVHITGESENGEWYRVEINGEEGYIRSSVFEEYLIDLPETSEETVIEAETEAAPPQTTETTTVVTTVVETVVEVPVETAAPTPTPVPAAPAVNQYSEISAYEILDMVNNYRAENGLGPLSWSADLQSSAYIRANECVVSFAHTRPDGSQFWTAGSQSAYAENIACGNGGNANFQALFDSWVNSDGHRANMLNPDFHTIGCSAVSADGVLYVVQHFGY